MAASSVQTLAPGDSVNILCSTTLSVVSTSTDATLTCAAPSATPTPSPTPVPTAVPTATPSPTPVPTATATGPNPLTCTGYPEPRVFLEAQGWWIGDGVESLIGANASHGSHVHVGTCFPWGQRVSGNVSFDVRILLHDNPGKLIRIRPQLWYDGGFSVQNEVYFNKTYPMPDSTIWQKITVDTNASPFDGLQEMRFFTQVTHTDGADQEASTGWALDIRNGKTLNHYKPDAQAPNFHEGRGWYEDTEYSNGRFEELPLIAPVSGIWAPDLKMTAGAGGTPVTFHAAYIDPNFHAGSHGIVVKQGQGKWDGDVAIDTRTLSNGLHKLVLRADSTISSGTNSGIFVIQFTVKN
ncbi:MAG: hypothetical protein LC798_18840 [Chloroflexi bacterium]|nr:hypothetical protein [Chloroflexota bacterium]